MKCYKIDFGKQSHSHTAYVVSYDAKSAISKAESYIKDKYNDFWQVIGLELLGEGFE